MSNKFVLKRKHFRSQQIKHRTSAKNCCRHFKTCPHHDPICLHSLHDEAVKKWTFWIFLSVLHLTWWQPPSPSLWRRKKWKHSKCYGTFAVLEDWNIWLWGLDSKEERYCSDADVSSVSPIAGRSVGYIASQIQLFMGKLHVYNCLKTPRSNEKRYIPYLHVCNARVQRSIRHWLYIASVLPPDYVQNSGSLKFNRWL